MRLGWQGRALMAVWPRAAYLLKPSQFHSKTSYLVKATYAFMGSATSAQICVHSRNFFLSVAISVQAKCSYLVCSFLDYACLITNDIHVVFPAQTITTISESIQYQRMARS